MSHCFYVVLTVHLGFFSDKVNWYPLMLLYMELVITTVACNLIVMSCLVAVATGNNNKIMILMELLCT